ncbi:MAG: DUF2207 domain-containing protein [Desulfobulbus sp.]|nr:DUF2207 domain-containing protein [Desulfobulbus sp.]
MKHRWLLLILLLLATALPGMAEERVLNFASTVHIQENGALLVREKITVAAEGHQIKRGIVREFPTRYTDGNGRTVRVGFELLAVARNDRPEPYHTKSLSNGVAIYAGQKDVFLRPGRYTYTIEYKTTRQLGFFADHDELYWNVNGNGWRLPTDRVSCDVFLPQGARATEGWAYEGLTGSKDGYRLESTGATMRFDATRPYAPGEGLTIAVSWPKGFVTGPSSTDKALSRLADQGSLAPATIGACLLLVYYLLAWLKVGRDPAKGIIIPRFAPPKGFSPAMVRMLWKMGFDNTAFTAGIINMAVCGGLTINEQDKTSLELSDQAPLTLSVGERAAWNELQKGGTRLRLEKTNHRIINRARQAMQDKLSKELASSYFLTNSLWLVPGIGLTLLTIGGMAWFAKEPPLILFMSAWLTGWTFGCVTLVRQAMTGWKARGVMGKLSAVMLSLFALPFLAGEVVGIGFLLSQTGLIAGSAFLVMILMNALFYELLKAPTRIGRATLDEIEGFKLYLSVAEKDRLNFSHPPNETPELFEQFLPYAIALGVENQWGERFADVLNQAGYAPQWYHGHHWNHLHPATFAGALGSGMESTVSSASTAPGSSSGSGGGGSSGGGGGGGGGGGW